MVEPNNTTNTKNATTSSNGTASWSYRLGPKDPKGTYLVSAQVTYGGQTFTTPQVTFTVK
jgi:hypothetical protein